MGIQTGLPQGPSTGQLGLTLGDWPSGSRSLEGKDEAGLLGLECSLGVNLDHGIEKHFRKIKTWRKMGKAFNLFVCLCKSKELNFEHH